MKKLLALDLDTVTPKEALELLYTWRREAESAENDTKMTKKRIVSRISAQKTRTNDEKAADLFS